MQTRGERLLHAREHIARMSRPQLAEALEISIEQLRKYEAGEAPVRLIHTWGLAAVLGVRQPWLAEGTGYAVAPSRIIAIIKGALPGLDRTQGDITPIVQQFIASLEALVEDE